MVQDFFHQQYVSFREGETPNQLMQLTEDNFVKLVSWYDNEWGFCGPKWVRKRGRFFLHRKTGIFPMGGFGRGGIFLKKNTPNDFVAKKKRSVCFILIRPRTEVRTKVCIDPQIPCQAALFRKMETGEVRVLPVRWCRIISSYWSWCGGFQVF